MTSKPLPQIITIDYWWNKTKASHGRYRVLMAGGLICCCLAVLSLLALKLLLDMLSFFAHAIASIAENFPSESEDVKSPHEDGMYAQYHHDVEKYGYEVASKIYGMDD